MAFLPEVRLEGADLIFMRFDTDLMFMRFEKNVFTHFEFFSADGIDLLFFHILPTQCTEYFIIQMTLGPIV